MNIFFRLACVLVVVASPSLFAQPVSEREIRAKLDAVYSGKADEIRSELPSLLLRYPNDAGVQYIQAVLTFDGAAAVKRYEEIARKYPESVWADDALYKVYQYDYSNGLYKKADEVMERLRSSYPRSIYVATGSASSSSSGSEAPVKKEEPVAAPKPSATAAAPAAAAPHEGGGIYSVQAGLFSTEANARVAAKRCTDLSGRDARVQVKTSGEKTVYLVVFEGFASSESAKRFSAELKTRHNIDSFVNPR